MKMRVRVGTRGCCRLLASTPGALPSTYSRCATPESRSMPRAGGGTTVLGYLAIRFQEWASAVGRRRADAQREGGWVSAASANAESPDWETGRRYMAKLWTPRVSLRVAWAVGCTPSYHLAVPRRMVRVLGRRYFSRGASSADEVPQLSLGDRH